MSTHAKVETLSAYLDKELPADEASLIEEHLASCEVCSQRLDGMRSVVSSLHHLERMAPPPTLDQFVARRIKLEGEEKSLVDRIETSLTRIPRQSSLMALFAMVIAFAAIMMLFIQAVHDSQNTMTPVIFHDPAADPSTERALAGRLLALQDGIWVEDGTDSTSAERVAYGSEAWRVLVLGDSSLAELRKLEDPVMVLVDGKTFLVHHTDQ